MAYRVVMPRLSDTMEEGKILRWIKKEGERVEIGDVIAEIATDKADVEVEAYASGVLRKILAQEGETIPIGTIIAIIAEEDENITELEEEARKKPPKVEAIEERVEEEMPVKEEIPERIKASPLAMRLAMEKGIDISKVKGTGPSGRITERDVKTYLAGIALPAEIKLVPPTEEPYVEEELSLMRKTIARKMTQSKGPLPHFYLTSEIHMDKAIELRDYLNSLEEEVKISFNDMIVKATAKALKKYPQINASFAGDKIRYYRGINIGVAVALEEGLVTPVIKACDIKGLGRIAGEIKNLTEKARNRKLKPEEYADATFTVSNLGMYDVENFSAIINPPEGAILAVGAITKKAIVVEDKIIIGHITKITLSCDHRIIDGATGAKFLQELKRVLENPILLTL